MDAVFEQGNEESPRGHAIIYFRSNRDPDEILATCLIILPINVDIAKYVPPFLMGQVGDLGLKDLSAFAFPPAPEQVAGHSYITELAEIRGDDLIYGGTINPDDVPAGMMKVGEVTQWYAGLYTSLIDSHTVPETNFGSLDAGFGVNEVLYGLMSEGDKLSELTKLVGRLRFANEGGEASLAKEAEVDMHLLATHLPEEHNIGRLVEVAKAGGKRAEALADLYLQRCFHIMHEEYVRMGDVERRIEELEAQGPLG
jgi:hypothetical protein